MELSEYMTAQEAFSSKAFGPGKRTVGIVKHVQKELQEILNDPNDIEEWIDVVILGLDGYWRAGGIDIESGLRAKLAKNMSREWPPPGPEDEASEHVGGMTDHVVKLVKDIQLLDSLLVEKNKVIAQQQVMIEKLMAGWASHDQA